MRVETDPGEVSATMAAAWREDFRADLQALIERHAPRASFMPAVVEELRGMADDVARRVEEVPPIRRWP